MGHLNELNEKYADKGLVVLAVTDEGKGLVDKFVADTGATHPIVIESTNSSQAFGISGFPSSFLVGADGRIAWKGHPAGIKDDLIERLLQDVRLLPELPKSLSSITKRLEKREFGKARADLAKKLEGERLDEEEKAAAEAAIAWIDGTAASLDERVTTALENGDPYEASLALERLEAEFDGMEGADRAKDRLKELLKDKEAKREIDAGRVLAKTRERARGMDAEDAAALYRALARKFEGTKAAEKAALLAGGK